METIFSLSDHRPGDRKVFRCKYTVQVWLIISKLYNWNEIQRRGSCVWFCREKSASYCYCIQRVVAQSDLWRYSPWLSGYFILWNQWCWSAWFLSMCLLVSHVKNYRLFSIVKNPFQVMEMKIKRKKVCKCMEFTRLFILFPIEMWENTVINNVKKLQLGSSSSVTWKL